MRDFSTEGGITLLGSGTCQLQTDRMASSVLIELNTTRLVFDFGRGISLRLSEHGLKQNDLNHIVLSHFHPDHISDLIPYLHAARWSRIDPRTTDLNIYGPTGTESFISAMIDLFGTRALTGDSFSVFIHDIPAGDFSIEDFSFSFIHLPPHNNHGIRFSVNGKSYAITGDSDFHQKEFEFLRNADIAVIDAGHISDEEIVLLASQSRIRTLVCSHLYRQIDADKLTATAQSKGFNGTIIMASDMMAFDF